MSLVYDTLARWSMACSLLAHLAQEKQPEFFIFSFFLTEKYGMLHKFVCHPYTGAMLIFSVSFQF